MRPLLFSGSRIVALTFGRDDFGDSTLLDQMSDASYVFEWVPEFFHGGAEYGRIGHAHVFPVDLMQGSFQRLFTSMSIYRQPLAF